MPLRGNKATLWEGGVRSQTFVHWEGLPAHLRGSTYGGMAHASDWGVTLQAALGLPAAAPRPGEPPLDGKNLWPALTSGGASPRTEMLLSMRDVGQCAAQYSGCTCPGQLAYRRGKYKLIYGHTALRGHVDSCSWSVDRKSGAGSLDCWNGWGVPKDRGAPRPPIAMPSRPGQPANSSLYAWGATFLYDIENDPLEEKDLSAALPEVVADLKKALDAYAGQSISQDVQKDPQAKSEACGDALMCAVPWKPYEPANRCIPAPTPAPAAPTPAPPTPPTPPVPGTNCCQCLKEGGGAGCGPKFCDKKGGDCKSCVDSGSGAACRPKCGCK